MLTVAALGRCCVRLPRPAATNELAARWAATRAQDQAPEVPRRLHYMSMEFLMGRALRNTLSALELDEEMAGALAGSEPPLADVVECEAEPWLGNGGRHRGLGHGNMKFGLNCTGGPPSGPRWRGPTSLRWVASRSTALQRVWSHPG
jgi:hypothetical protein